MAGLAKPLLPPSLDEGEREMLLALGAMLENADAVTLSSKRVAILVDAHLFDVFNAAVDVATGDDSREFAEVDVEALI